MSCLSGIHRWCVRVCVFVRDSWRGQAWSRQLTRLQRGDILQTPPPSLPTPPPPCFSPAFCFPPLSLFFCFSIISISCTFLISISPLHSSILSCLLFETLMHLLNLSTICPPAQSGPGRQDGMDERIKRWILKDTKHRWENVVESIWEPES